MFTTLTVGIAWAQTLTDYAPDSSDDEEDSEAVKKLDGTLGASTGRLELAYEYRVSGVEDDGGFKGNIGGTLTLAWDTFHLKVGLYYGYYVLPMIGAFVESPLSAIPEIDLSWRW